MNALQDLLKKKMLLTFIDPDRLDELEREAYPNDDEDGQQILPTIDLNYSK